MSAGPKPRHSLYLEDEARMAGFARDLAVRSPIPCRFYLNGPLGAGKTTLVRAYLAALGYEGAVRSPTYTLIESYPLSDRTVVHMDLYRLLDPEELEYLGVRDYLDGPVQWFVEWAEKGAGVLPAPDVELTLSYADTPQARALAMAGAIDPGFLYKT